MPAAIPGELRSVKYRRVILFSVAGFVGFLVDSGTLWLVMRWFDVGPYAGRAISFMVAASATWQLNRVLTYRDRRQPAQLATQWIRYLAASGLGAIVNYLTFCGFIFALPIAAAYPVIGVAAGSVAGMFFNYGIYNKIVFAADSKPQDANAAHL